MIFTVNVPTLRVRVRSQYLGLSSTDTTEGYLVSVTSIPSGPLMFSCHLETGALWQRLPIEAFVLTKNLYPVVSIEDPRIFSNEELQPFSCLSGDVQCIVLEHLRDYSVLAKVGDFELTGTYLFTVDVLGQGLASDPVQHKTHNVVVLENGQLAALPNNHVLFKDLYFTVANKDFPKYSRLDKAFKPGG